MPIVPMMVNQPTPILPVNVPAPVSGTWRDGDGQLIAAPRMPQRPAGPANWLDGDGQLIAPPRP